MLPAFSFNFVHSLNIFQIFTQFSVCLCFRWVAFKCAALSWVVTILLIIVVSAFNLGIFHNTPELGSLGSWDSQAPCHSFNPDLEYVINMEHKCLFKLITKQKVGFHLSCVKLFQWNKDAQKCVTSRQMIKEKNLKHYQNYIYTWLSVFNYACRLKFIFKLQHNFGY